MKNLHLIAVLAFSVSLGLPTDTCFAQTAPARAFVREKHNTSDFVRVENRVAKLSKQHALGDVLLVVDIDNTLLAMNQDLGSDQWFNWQAKLLDEAPDSQDLVAADFDSLLAVQGTLFAISGMHPPDPKLPAMVKRIQASGVATVVLTSRSPDFRDAAERELRANGYDFGNPANDVQMVEQRGVFKPFDPALPNAHGLSEEVIANVTKAPRNVTYADGLYMTAGQHKGYMLKTLLARAVVSASEPGTKRNFKAIVFVDDHHKHTNRMHDAFEGEHVDLITYHYMQEDGNVRNFENSSKQHVVRDWNRLKDFIETVLVK